MSPTNLTTFPRLLMLAAALSTVVGVSSRVDDVDAHNPANWFEGEWTIGTDVGLRRGYNSGLGLSNSDLGYAGRRAGEEWDNAPNNIGADAPEMVWAGTTSQAPSGNACASNFDGEILYGSGTAWGTTAIASTHKCYFGGTTTIRRVSLVLDTDENWFWTSGTSTPVANAYDVQAVLTHELGHAMGWGITHLGQTNSSLCSSSGSNHVHTMCGGGILGSYEKRTLQDHDKHTYDEAYD